MLKIKTTTIFKTSEKIPKYHQNMPITSTTSDGPRDRATEKLTNHRAAWSYVTQGTDVPRLELF